MNKTSSRQAYSERIHLVIDYISEHLSEDISLEKLAAVACFSPFHFHRIFSAFTGETPREYMERVKLEKAANRLCLMPHKSVSEIAFECGYTSASSFSRSFKKHHGISPSVFLEKHRENFHSLNVWAEKKPPIYQAEDFATVRIRNLPPLHVAYLQTLNGYSDGIPKSWKQLLRYMKRHDLMEPDAWYVGMPFDNPGITPQAKCRYRACLSINHSFVQTKGEIKTADLEGGKYAMYPFKGRREDISDAYAFLYGGWLPQSGYIPDEKPLLEIYPPELHQVHYTEILEYEIALPVIPL
jgi:AraC family transcriptional regulator